MSKVKNVAQSSRLSSVQTPQQIAAAKLKEHDERGLECPECQCHHFYVIYTRKREERIVRRRECRHCGPEDTDRREVDRVAGVARLQIRNSCESRYC